MPDKTSASKPYRPSNGSEGEGFQARFCNQCAKDTPSHACGILSRSMAFDIGDKKYPRQLIEDAKGPRCTAFADAKKPKPSIINDDRQIGMQL